MSCKPTFLLKPSAYKTNKLYAIIPDSGDGDLPMFGYAGNGTRVNPDGFIESVATDTPRIDHLNGGGLLLEPTRENAVFSSEQMTGGFWTHNVTQTVNDTISPDGTKNASKIEDLGTGSQRYSRFLMTTTPVLGDVWSYSCFIKFGNTDSIQIRHEAFTTGPYELVLDVDRAGVVTISTDDFGGSTAKSINYGNGWFRVESTLTFIVTSQLRYAIYPSYEAGTGQDVGYCWLWGTQIEKGGFCTSYIPTVSSFVTRTSDSASRTLLDTNGMVSTTNSAFVVDLTYDATVTPDGSASSVQLGTTNGQLLIVNTNGIMYASVQNGDSTYTSVALPSTGRAKVGFNIATDNVDIWVQGVKEASTAKAFSLTNDTLVLRGDSVAVTILEAAIYNRTLTDSEMQRITQ